MQNWKDLYIELAEKISDGLEQVQWVDLWHNQVNFLEEEHPFPSPAVFLQFRSMEIEDQGNKAQKVKLQVDCFVFYETFADTYHDSWNADKALVFIELLNDVYALLHATSGENYSNMKRIGMHPVDTGNAGNLYQISFECTLMDYAAQDEYVNADIEEVEVERFNISITP